MFSTFHARISERFCKNDLHFLPISHHPWRSLTLQLWEKALVRAWQTWGAWGSGGEWRCGGPELKGGLGLIFWTGATHTSARLQGNKAPPLGPALLSSFASLNRSNPPLGSHIFFPLGTGSQIISGFLWIVLREMMGRSSAGMQALKIMPLEGAPTKIIKPSSRHARLRLSQADVGSIRLPNKYYWVVI